MEGVLAFIKRAENLKNTFRLSFTTTGKRESSAEHSWRLCLLVLLFGGSFPGLNLEKCFKLAVVHDLAEAVCGDTPAVCREQHKAKAAVERQALEEIIQPLPEALGREVADLWREYEGATTAEARYVKALDKLETLIQHNQGLNPPDFDYAFNLGYGLDATGTSDIFAALRTLIDDETRAHMARRGL